MSAEQWGTLVLHNCDIEQETEGDSNSIRTKRVLGSRCLYSTLLSPACFLFPATSLKIPWSCL